MKKLLIILFSALLMLSLCSCGSQSSAEQSLPVSEGQTAQTAVITENTSQEESVPSSETDLSYDKTPEFSDTTDYSGTLAARFVDADRLSDRTKKNAVDIINGNAFYLDANGTLALPGGVSMEFSAAAARDGDKLFLHTSALGGESLIIRNDDGIYSIDTAEKKASLIKGGDFSPFYSNEVISKAITYMSYVSGSGELSFVRGGSEEYQGSVLGFEEYKSGSSSIKLYYDNDTLKYITADSSGTVSQIEVNSLSSSPDPALFALPEGISVE